MKKILHLINNDNDGIFHFVSKLVETSLKEHDNKILAKYSNNKNIILLDSGISLTQFLYKPIYLLKNPIEFLSKLKNKLKRDFFKFFFKPNSLFNFNFNEIDIYKLKNCVKEVEILFIYTFKEVISPKDLKKIQDHYKCKIFFYPLDYELLSGGYHFENLDYNNKSLEKKNEELINYKIKYTDDLNINWIAANKFVEKKIKSSKIYNWQNHKISKIYNTLKKFNFSQEEINNFKMLNNLSKYDKILLFSSLKLSDKRKGIDELKNCLSFYENLKEKNNKIAIISLGKELNQNLTNKKIEHIHFNYIQDYRKLNLLFSSCDIFINLSKWDFGPVLCEIAFLNNLFIFSSNVGISSEIIINEVNGFIYENNEEINEKFDKIIDLSLKNNKPEKNDQITLMKNVYTLEKDLKFNQLFNE